jgi:hypothetical protein
MTRPNRNALRELAEMADRLERCLSERNLPAASPLIDEVVGRAKQLGVRSAFITFLQAIFTDLNGDPLGAYAHIKEASMLDPAAGPIWHSEGIIVRHLRDSLRAPGRPDDDDNTLRVWRLLADLGEADDHVHLACVRFHVARGNLNEAMAVISALNVLAPGNRDAWLLRATIATKLNDEEQAARARAEAAAIEGDAVPFAVAAEAKG